MRNLYTLLFLFVFCFATAQNPSDLIERFIDGTLPSNYYFYKNNPQNASTPKVAVQPDGKILVNSGNGLERIDNNVKDLSFNIGTGFTTVPYYSWNPPCSIDFVAVQPDGKILVGGTNFTHYNGTAVNCLLRLNSDGSLDTSFNVTTVWDFVIQPNGKIVVLGRSNLTPALMFRLENDGALDPTFNVSAFSESRNIEQQADGKFLVAKNSLGYSLLKRYNSDGSLDVTFNSAGSGFASSNKIEAIATQSDGKILVCGEFTTYNDVAVEDLIRLNIDGSLDGTFTLPGGGLSNVKNILVDSQDRILLGGDSNLGISPSGNLIRLNSDGTVDTSFIISSQVEGSCYPNSVFNGTALQPDGKILLWKNTQCSVQSFKYEGVGRLNADGTIDRTFNTGGGFNDKVNVIALQNDNKILIGGDFNTFNGETFNYIVRLNPDYSIDRTFNIGTGFNKRINAIVVQDDGKILIGGDFYYYNGFYVKRLIRLNQDGSIDTSFIAPSDPNSSVVNRGFDGGVRAITLQSDGKILVGGAFLEYYDSSHVRIVSCGLVRLNSDSSTDTSLNMGVYGFDLPVNAVTVGSDGKIYVGGSFVRVSCCGNYYVSSKYLCALNANGTIFRTYNFTGQVNTLVADANGSLLAGHEGGLARVTGTGYTPIVTGAVKAITLQPDGKILIGGNITKFNDLTLNSRFARLNRDASLDVGCDSRNLFDGTVYAINVKSDGKILVAGNFMECDGERSKRMAVLRGDAFYNISGNSKIDFNNNGCDATDLIYPSLEFQISDGQTQIPNSSGNYSYSLSPGNYTITPILDNPTYFSVTPASLTVDFPSQGNSLTQNFCITPNGVHSDLEVALLPIDAARPGFNAKYKLVYKNNGNQLESGTVTLNYDDMVLDFASSIPSVTSQTTNSFSWVFTNLKPLESKEITLTLNLNTPTETPPLTSGSILNYTANIASTLTDDTPNDNTFTLNQTVVNSYDPNDKTCLQGTTITPDKVGEYVHYVIRFENSGTYPVQTITIRDFIDTDKFDISTLTPVKGSHLFTTKISEGNKVEFVFQNINLPYFVGSNTGYVAFKIKTKPTLVLGDTFSNGAGIYFDYNSAITTNTYTTTIQTLSNPDFSFANYFTLYPNPVSDTLNISKKGEIEVQSIHIYNTLGQLVVVIPNARDMATIDVSNLAAGNYFVKINSDKGTSNTKFIKK